MFPARTISQSVRLQRSLRFSHAERTLAGLALLTAATCPLAQTLQIIPALPGGAYTYPTGISADGSVVAGGNVLPSGDFDRGFTWTSAGGSQPIGDLAGYSLGNTVNGISGDGSTVVGLAFDADFNTGAFRYRGGATVNLGRLAGPGASATANGVSHDGTAVAGTSTAGESSDNHAFRWTNGGMQDLGVLLGGTYSLGQAISGDGGVVVGNGNIGSDGRAFRWDQTDGIMPPLGSLPGSTFDGAYAVSADGNTVAGASGGQAVRWTSETPQPLGALPGMSYSVATTVSRNGEVIAGNYSGGTFIWSQSSGSVDFKGLLASRGLDVAGWEFFGINGMSADGSTLVGFGSFGGDPAGFMVTGLAVPELAPTATVAALGLLGFAAASSRYRNRRR